MFSLLPVVLVVAAPADPLPKSLARYFTPPAEFAGQLGDYRSPLRFADGTEVKTAADWKRRRQEILKTWHDLMGPQPEPIAKPKLEILDGEHDENFTRHHVRIEVAPGKLTDDAYLLVPDGKGPFPAVLVVFYDALTGIGKKGKMRDFALQLAKRGFVTLSLGSPPESYYPTKETCKLQPLSYHAYVASNCRRALANRPDVDGSRIGIVGHSYGGKWAMFASCLDDQFACAVWSDPGIVFDEKRPNVNYWEPWYLGFAGGPNRGFGHALAWLHDAAPGTAGRPCPGHGTLTAPTRLGLSHGFTIPTGGHHRFVHRAAGRRRRPAEAGGLRPRRGADPEDALRQVPHERQVQGVGVIRHAAGHGEKGGRSGQGRVERDDQAGHQP